MDRQTCLKDPLLLKPHHFLYDCQSYWMSVAAQINLVEFHGHETENPYHRMLLLPNAFAFNNTYTCQRKEQVSPS